MLTKMPTPETMMMSAVITTSTVRTLPRMSDISRCMGMIGLTACTLCPRFISPLNMAAAVMLSPFMLTRIAVTSFCTSQAA